jgi:hypothetical protein
MIHLIWNSSVKIKKLSISRMKMRYQFHISTVKGEFICVSINTKYKSLQGIYGGTWIQVNRLQ